MKFKLTKLDLIASIILFLINYFLKVPLVSKGFFAFTYDQGRDFLAATKIVKDLDLTLIGPTTGLPGIFYGPWWYYFLSPILILTGGDPQKVAILFAFFGILTSISIYFFIKYLTNNYLIALSLSLVASMSSFYLFSPIIIWSPTLAPFLMIIFLVLAQKISKSPKPLYFFILGAVSILIADSGAAFGIVLTLALFVTPLLFRETFFKKEFLLTILGAVVILLPRIIFELKNNLLISRAVFSYFTQPKVYGEELPITERFWQKADLFWGIFSSSFARENKTVGLLIIIFILSFLFVLLMNKTRLTKIKSDFLLKYSVFLLIVFFISFTIFPDIVWDYYLVGLPIIFASIMAKVFYHAIKIDKLKIVVFAFLFLLIILNFKIDSFKPVKITWEGDGAIYRNQKMVMDQLASDKPQEYSLYAYSPAIFDYAFDYLTYWYVSLGLFEKPQENKQTMYLIIRDDQGHTYQKLGWYGDKTRDKSVLIFRRDFPGGLILEKHQRNEKI